MRDVIPDIDRWVEQGKRVAIATVVSTWGSAPRAVGAKMAVSQDLGISGSVSGGCVEGAVVEASQRVLDRSVSELLHFGVADETAWDVGLACGGEIDVFVQPLDTAIYRLIRTELLADREVTHAFVIAGPAGDLGQEKILLEDGRQHGALSIELADLAREADGGSIPTAYRWRPAERTGSPSPEAESPEIFVERFAGAPKLILVGGVHIAVALAALAKPLGFRTVVIDPRNAFGTQERFPQVDRLVQAWPTEALAEEGLTSSSAIVMLTHDPKIDDPALLAALASPAFYVGGLGSKSTQEKRVRRLRAAGLDEAAIARLHGPVGLDLGGRTPEEIAVAILAQIVAARHGRLDERGGLPSKP